MRVFQHVTLSALALCLAATGASAQDAPIDPDRDTFTIGVGGGIAPTYEGSDNYRIIPGAIVRGSVGGFSFVTIGTNLFVDLVPSRSGDIDFQLGPVAGINLNRTSRSGLKDARVRALTPPGGLDTAIEVGGYAGIAKTGIITSDYDRLSVSIAYQQDVADAHDSYVITPALNYLTPLSRTTAVGIGVSADIVGDKFANYYYGITPAGAAASGLPAYTAEGGLKNVSLSLLGAQSLSGDLRRGWSLFAVGSYSKLMGDFKRSPIVAVAGDSTQWFGAVGIGYTF